MTVHALRTFDDFWRPYPRKVAKLDAQRAWAKLTPAQQMRAYEALPAHVAEWSDREPRHIPHAATWLNGHRFNDELEPAAADAAAQVRRVLGA